MDAVTCAVCNIDTGLVVNVIVASPSDDCPIVGCHLVEIQGGIVLCAIGDKWDGNAFVSKNPTAIIPDENGEV
jgi:hypothetical protein